MKRAILGLLTAGVLCAELDPRLNVNTLVREDIFAGFMANDMERFTRGEQTLERLLSERPNDRRNIRAWQGGAALYRAARANEAGKSEEFDLHYKRAVEAFDEAAKLERPEDIGVKAVTGGSYVLFADRLPEKYRAEAWSAAYRSYQGIWKLQQATVEKMPIHIKGELLAGMAQTAHRTGRQEELAQYLDRMLTMLAGSPYEARAKKWKENPEIDSTTSLTCQTCHESGRLEARKASLK